MTVKNLCFPPLYIPHPFRDVRFFHLPSLPSRPWRIGKKRDLRCLHRHRPGNSGGLEKMVISADLRNLKGGSNSHKWRFVTKTKPHGLSVQATNLLWGDCWCGWPSSLFFGCWTVDKLCGNIGARSDFFCFNGTCGCPISDPTPKSQVWCQHKYYITLLFCLKTDV